MTETPFTNKTAFYSRPFVLETFRFHNRVNFLCSPLWQNGTRSRNGAHLAQNLIVIIIFLYDACL